MAENRVSAAIQRLVRERAKGYCEYCLCPSTFSPDSFTFDHIIPISLGGETLAENLAFSCGGCNGHKFNKTHYPDPLTNRLARLFHPRQHIWKEHFQWSTDDLAILGLTPIGRTTIDLLRVNRPGNINLRGLLKMAGLHPPVL